MLTLLEECYKYRQRNVLILNYIIRKLPHKIVFFPVTSLMINEQHFNDNRYLVNHNILLIEQYLFYGSSYRQTFKR